MIRTHLRAIGRRRAGRRGIGPRGAAPAAAALTLALGLSACGAANEDSSTSDPSNASSETVSGTLNAAGSSAQEAAVSAWQKGFQSANPDVTVNYDPIGSGGGREQFISGGVDLAGSDAYMTDEELSKAEKRCGSDVVEVPVYNSPIAIVYNLQGLDELNLSPSTIGAIFEGKIKAWDDPKIKADNPDADLPDTRITPVHRSDDSGTTENFTDYLDQASDGAWTGGKLESWPVQGGEGATGTSGVVSAVKGGNGTIGYADASQAGDLGVAKVKVGNTFVEYSPEAAGAILDASKQVPGRGAGDLAIDVDRTSTADGVYPIVLISYQIACTEYENQQTADLVKAWLTHVSSSDGQRAAAEGAGSAPLPPGLESKIKPIVAGISATG